MPNDITQLNVPSNPDHWVYQIYQCAIKKDATGLKNLLAQGVCIDERYQSSPLTAAAQLAFEKDTASVQFLLDFGANVNLTAFGVALANDPEYIEAFVFRYYADLSYVIRGLAAAGNFILADRFSAYDVDQREKMAKWFAWGRHLMLANQHRTESNTHDIAYNAAQRGEREFADALLPLGGEDIVHSIAGGAARGGHFDHAEFYRVHRNASVKVMAKNAALGGHRGFTEYLRTHFKIDESITAAAAAFSGHRQYSEFLRTRRLSKKKTTKVAAAAAKGGHFVYVEDLYLNHKADIKEIAAAVINKPHFKNPNVALRIFSFIATDQFRNALALELSHYAKDHVNVCYNILKMAEKSKYIRALQQKYNFTYDQAFTWMTEPKLRDFVLLFHQLTTTLPAEIFLRVMKYLFLDVSTKDQAVFFNARNMLSNANIRELQSSLSKYSYGLFNPHRMEAKSLLTNIHTAKTYDEVNKMLTTQLETGVDSEFQKIIKRHCRK